MTLPASLRNTILVGDVRERVRDLPPASIHCIITSIPYWGLRDYGIESSVWDGEPGCAHEWGDQVITDTRGLQTELSETLAGPQREDARKSTRGAFCRLCGAWLGAHGLEPTPELYIKHEVQIWNAVRPVLRRDGSLWLNVGDSYIGGGRGGIEGAGHGSIEEGRYQSGQRIGRPTGRVDGYKPKDLAGIPEQLVLALRADGWYWRCRIPWIKRNCMPESADDRPTTAVEYLMLFSVSAHYYYDAEAVRLSTKGSNTHSKGQAYHPSDKTTLPGKGIKSNESFAAATWERVSNRMRRNSDWFLESWQGMLLDDDGDPLAMVVNTHGFKGAHFATFPERFVEPCILAGTSEAGCCPDCGAPWERVMEKERTFESGSGRAGNMPAGKRAERLQGGGETLDVRRGPVVHATTLGFRPTCAHYDSRYLEEMPRSSSRKQAQHDAWGQWWPRARLRPGNPTWPHEPVVVADPFGGSGTVGRVARRLRRDYVLCEISEPYAEMARQRIEHGTGDPVEVREAERQLTLFDTSQAKVIEKTPAGWKTGQGNHWDLTGALRPR